MSFTFHVAFTFKDDESIPPTTTFFVANDSDAFDAAETFKFTAEVTVCCRFVL